MFSLMIVATLVLAQAKDQPREEIKTFYLKEDDLTLIELELGHFTNKAGTHLLSICTVYKGRKPKAMEDAIIQVFRAGPKWEYREAHDVQISCGEEKLTIRKVMYRAKKDPEHPDKKCIDWIDIDVSTHDLEEILEKGRDLALKVGEQEPEILHAPTRKKLLKFVKAIESGTY